MKYYPEGTVRAKKMPDDAASFNVNVRCTRRRVPGAADVVDDDSQEEGVESEQEQDPEVLRQQENQDEIDRDIQHLQEQLQQDNRDESIIQDYGEDPGPSQRQERGTKRTRSGAKARGTGRGRGRGGGSRRARSSASAGPEA